MERNRASVVVLGTAGQMPFAGMAWQVLHYLEGLRRLGCDVLYLEESEGWPYDPTAGATTEDASYAVAFVRSFSERFDFAWAYRGPGGELHGKTESELTRALGRADALINVTGGIRLRDTYMQVPTRIYLETDPVAPEVEIAHRNPSTLAFLAAHTHHFSFGERVGLPDWPIPTGDIQLKPTRQPVVVDWWSERAGEVPADAPLTTIGNWRQRGRDVIWEGETYRWSKHHEFEKFINLPRLSSVRFEPALSSLSVEDERLLRSHGWLWSDSVGLSLDLDGYSDFIKNSFAEFTVAKEQYVRLNTGWFSDRSACYLAAGRPVITQDTLFGEIIPTGEGLFAFRTMDDVLRAIDAILADRKLHQRRALEIARVYFDAEIVVGSLLAEVGL